MNLKELVEKPDIDREYIFREVAYKAYVKDKIAAKIADVVGTEIQKVLVDDLEQLLEPIKNGKNINPILKGFLSDENAITALKDILPTLVVNGTKWTIKYALADMLRESHQLKRLADDVLADSSMIHTQLLKSLVLRNMPAFAGALLDEKQKRELISRVKEQYEKIVQDEKLEKPSFNVEHVLLGLFTTVDKELGGVVADIKGNEELKEKEKVLLEALKFHSQGLPGDDSPVYSDIISLAAFDLAEAHSSLKWPLKKFDSFINNTITSLLYPYRRTPHREIVRIATQKLVGMAGSTPRVMPLLEIRIPYKVLPEKSHRLGERDALLEALRDHAGQDGNILRVDPKNPELVIQFRPNEKWLEANDKKLWGRSYRY